MELANFYYLRIHINEYIVLLYEETAIDTGVE